MDKLGKSRNVGYILQERKRKKSDSVLWQKPQYQQKCQKDKVTAQTECDYTAIAARLIAVSWSQNSHPTGVIKRFSTLCNSRVIKRTHVETYINEVSNKNRRNHSSVNFLSLWCARENVFQKKKQSAFWMA